MAILRSLIIFISVPFATKLLPKNTYMTRTIWSDRKVTKAKLGKGETVTCYGEDIMDKSSVYYISRVWQYNGHRKQQTGATKRETPTNSDENMKWVDIR